MTYRAGIKIRIIVVLLLSRESIYQRFIHVVAKTWWILYYTLCISSCPISHMAQHNIKFCNCTDQIPHSREPVRNNSPSTLSSWNRKYETVHIVFTHFSRCESEMVLLPYSARSFMRILCNDIVHYMYKSFALLHIPIVNTVQGGTKDFMNTPEDLE